MAAQEKRLEDAHEGIMEAQEAINKDNCYDNNNNNNIQIDDIINFKSNGKKLKIFYVRWSRTSSSRLKVKKLTIKLNQKSSLSKASSELTINHKQPTYRPRTTSFPDQDHNRDHIDRVSDDNQKQDKILEDDNLTNTICHDKILINHFLEQVSSSLSKLSSISSHHCKFPSSKKLTSNTSSSTSSGFSSKDSTPIGSLTRQSISSNSGTISENVILDNDDNNDNNNKIIDNTNAPILASFKRVSKRVFELASRAELLKLERALERHMQRMRDTRPRRLILFVNPHGGKGKAVYIFKNYIKPLLELAQVEYSLFVTQHANHAREMIENPEFQLESYDALIGVGGDGMFAELMNGLLFRCNNSNNNDDKNNSDENDKSSIPYIECDDAVNNPTNNASTQPTKQFKTPTIPIGIISAGSTDANSFGFIGTNDVKTATLNIILGNKINIDVCSLHSYESHQLLGFASTFVAYGYFGDVIRESEKLRWLGPSRYDLTGFNNVLKHRSYQGQLRMLVSESDGSPLDSSQCDTNCTVCHNSDNSNKKTMTNDESNASDNDAKCREKLKLVELEGPFVGVNAAITACRCPKTRKGFSPSQHLANGCADLIVVQQCSRLQYLRYLLRTGYSSKSAFKLSYVSAYRCREFEFIPDLETGKPSSWNVDGEQLSGDNSIRVCVNKKLLQVFGIA